VRELSLDTRPEVVLSHPLRDMHPDHRRIAEALLDALSEAVTGHPGGSPSLTTDGSLSHRRCGGTVGRGCPS